MISWSARPLLLIGKHTVNILFLLVFSTMLYFQNLLKADIHKHMLQLLWTEETRNTFGG